jgi:hypothetical protein
MVSLAKPALVEADGGLYAFTGTPTSDLNHGKHFSVELFCQRDYVSQMIAMPVRNSNRIRLL